MAPGTYRQAGASPGHGPAAPACSSHPAPAPHRRSHLGPASHLNIPAARTAGGSSTGTPSPSLLSPSGCFLASPARSDTETLSPAVEQQMRRGLPPSGRLASVCLVKDLATAQGSQGHSIESTPRRVPKRKRGIEGTDMDMPDFAGEDPYGVPDHAPTPGTKCAMSLSRLAMHSPSPMKKRKVDALNLFRPPASPMVSLHPDEPPRDIRVGTTIYMPDPWGVTGPIPGGKVNNKRLVSACLRAIIKAPATPKGKKGSKFKRIQRAFRVQITEPGHPLLANAKGLGDPTLLKVLSKNTRMCHVPARNGVLDMPAFGVIANFLTLQELMQVSLTNVYWYRTAFKHLESLTPICKNYNGIKPKNLSHFLCRMSPALKSLDLRFVCQAVRNETLTVIGSVCRGLRRFNIFNCDQITSQGLQDMVGSLKVVHDLNIAGCSPIDNSGVYILCRECPQLEELNVSWDFRVTTTSMGNIARLKHLKKLSLFETGGGERSFYQKIMKYYQQPREKPIHLVGGLNRQYPVEKLEEQKVNFKKSNIHYTEPEYNSISECRWKLKTKRFSMAKQVTRHHAFKVPQSSKVYCVVWTELGTFACKLKMSMVRSVSYDPKENEVLARPGVLREVKKANISGPERFIKWYNHNLKDPLSYFRDVLNIENWGWLQAFQNLVTLDMIGFDKCDWVTVGLVNYGGPAYEEAPDFDTPPVEPGEGWSSLSF